MPKNANVAVLPVPPETTSKVDEETVARQKRERLDEVMAKIGVDARDEPERYLVEARVEGGGE